MPAVGLGLVLDHPARSEACVLVFAAAYFTLLLITTLLTEPNKR